MSGSHFVGNKIHVSALDDKVKKSSSQSLLKMQAAQIMTAKEERKLVYKTPGGTVSKKAIDGGSGTTKVDISGSKKLIFSFKKDGMKQKVTPPNAPSSSAGNSKPASLGHHRRVQSHGQAQHLLNLK